MMFSRLHRPLVRILRTTTVSAGQICTQISEPVNLTSTCIRHSRGFRQIQTQPFVLNVRQISQATQAATDKIHNSDGEKNENIISATEQLAALSPEDQKRLKVLQLEYDVMFSMDKRVPDHMTDEMWWEIFQMETPSMRRRRYMYWFKKEKHNIKRKEKQAEKAKLRETALDEKANEPEIKSLRNAIHFHIRESTMTHHYYNNLAHAMMFGQPMVVDMSFEQEMTQREMVRVIDQIKGAHTLNKTNKEPFHMVLCGLQKDGFLQQALYKQIAFLNKIPITVTHESYMDMYPAQDIVYLSPNAPKTMPKFDYNKIYIMGGIVDLAASKPLTFARAKQQKITAYKLPLDDYFDWKLGGKSLTLDQMFGIMLDMYNTNDWEYAFRHIPKRKATPKPRRQY